MTRKMLTVLFIFSILLAPASADILAASSGSGGKAPDFTLPDTGGKNHSLSDYRGKFIVLEWINHDCPFVKKHYGSGNMQQLQKEYTAKGVVWFSVNSSAPGLQGHASGSEWNRMTKEKNASPTAVLLDPAGKVGRQYGAKTTPHMYLIDPKGSLIYSGAIDSVPSPDPADIPGATNYVRQALDAALSGGTPPVTATKSYGCSVKYGS